MASVQGVIDCTHIAISKTVAYSEDYWYFKTSVYLMVAQAVIDVKKLFTNLYVRLPGSVNNQKVLRRSGLWQQVIQRGLMNSWYGDIPPNNSLIKTTFC